MVCARAAAELVQVPGQRGALVTADFRSSISAMLMRPRFLNLVPFCFPGASTLAEEICSQENLIYIRAIEFGVVVWSGVRERIGVGNLDGVGGLLGCSFRAA